MPERLEPPDERLRLGARPGDDHLHAARSRRRREQHGGERRRIGAAAPLDPRPVLGGDQRRQLRAVVVGGDRREAAGADRRDTGALGLDPAARLGIVADGDELLLARPHLQRERALRRLGQHRLDRQPQADLAVEPEPVEPAGREHERVEAALAGLAQARVDVAAQRLDRERRLEREQLRAAADRRGADPHPRPELVGADERVARVVALEVRADGEALRVASRSCPSPSGRRRRSGRRAAPPRSP